MDMYFATPVYTNPMRPKKVPIIVQIILKLILTKDRHEEEFKYINFENQVSMHYCKQLEAL